ncbi:MAG: deoxyribose-phosphate aldolase [Planctomycetota bacterium]|nr:deoxyribose-phosphate aldolase [Planctomycetota bacterium]
MAAERAASFTKRSIKAGAKAAGLRLALSMLDLTTLEGKDTPQKIRGLCFKGVRPWERDEELLGERLPSVAAVCVYPSMVGEAARALRDAGNESLPVPVKIASVATGFPSGQYPLSVRLKDAELAIADGADEIDMVINRGAWLAGRISEVEDEIFQIASMCVQGRAGLKVILETGELETLDHVRRASDVAIAAMARAGLTQRPGAAFIKTSTGKVQPAATLPVTLVMLEAIRDWFFATGERVSMKPAGGVRTAKQALHYLVMVKETLGDAWLTPDMFRFGASALCNDILRQLAWLRRGSYAASYDFSEA